MRKTEAELIPFANHKLAKTRAGKAAIGIHAADMAEKIAKRIKDPERLQKALVTKINAQRDFAAEYRKKFPDGGDRHSKKFQNASSGALKKEDWCLGFGFALRTVQRWIELLDAIAFADKKEDIFRRSWRIAEMENMGTIRGTEGTGEFERYTPAQYIAAAREVLGEIDLDPASNAKAQRTVKALRYFTAKDDGLTQEWHGRIWLNPPYHRDLGPAFVDKMVAELEAGRITAAIMLTNNCTDTDWFDVALRASTSVCFTHGRIRFLQPNGNEVLPTQGQAFFYFGSAPIRFEEVFCRIGPCMRPTAPYSASENHGQDYIDSAARHDS